VSRRPPTPTPPTPKPPIPNPHFIKKIMEKIIL